ISWPRRKWVPLAVAGASVLVWATGFLLITTSHQRTTWIGLGAWSVIGGLYAAFMIGRNGREYDRLTATLDENEARRAALEQEVARAKARSARTEAEQREALALYGLV